MHNGLYLLQRSNCINPSSLTDYFIKHQSTHPSSFFVNSMISLPKVWHFRLGHPSINKLISLQDTLCVDFSSCIDVCHIYPLAKHKRLHFPFNNNLCASPFDLMHVHIWGPYFIPTHECFRFFCPLLIMLLEILGFIC